VTTERGQHRPRPLGACYIVLHFEAARSHLPPAASHLALVVCCDISVVAPEGVVDGEVDVLPEVPVLPDVPGDADGELPADVPELVPAGPDEPEPVLPAPLPLPPPAACAAAIAGANAMIAAKKTKISLIMVISSHRDVPKGLPPVSMVHSEQYRGPRAVRAALNRVAYRAARLRERHTISHCGGNPRQERIDVEG
jgi:hypothetical protein